MLHFRLINILNRFCGQNLKKTKTKTKNKKKQKQKQKQQEKNKNNKKTFNK